MRIKAESLESAKNHKDMSLKKDENGAYLADEEQDKDVLAEYNKFATRTAYNKEVTSNAVPEAMTLLGTAGTGLLAGAAINSFAGNPLKKISETFEQKGRKLFGNGSLDETKNGGGDTKGKKPNNSFDNQHGDSLQQNNKNYTKEYNKTYCEITL